MQVAIGLWPDAEHEQKVQIPVGPCPLSHPLVLLSILEGPMGAPFSQFRLPKAKPTELDWGGLRPECPVGRREGRGLRPDCPECRELVELWVSRDTNRADRRQVPRGVEFFVDKLKEV